MKRIKIKTKEREKEDTGKMEKIYIEITPEMKETLERKAEDCNMSFDEFVKHLLHIQISVF